MAHHDVPIGATTPIVPPFTIDLRDHVPARQRVIAFGAWTTVTLGAVVGLLLAGDELLARSRQGAEWWWHRPEGLVFGIVVLLTALSALLAERDGRADADRPIHDIR